MRSAHETTSPSGVAGAGRDQEWFRTPSVVWAHRLRPVSTTSAPQTAWSNPPGTYGLNASSLAWPAVMPHGDRLGQRDVEPQGTGDARRDLRDLEGVGQAGPLMVVREDEDLGLTRQPAERGGVQDA